MKTGTIHSYQVDDDNNNQNDTIDQRLRASINHLDNYGYGIYLWNIENELTRINAVLTNAEGNTQELVEEWKAHSKFVQEQLDKTKSEEAGLKLSRKR